MLCACVFGLVHPAGQSWAQSSRADKLELSIDSTLLGGEPIPDESATYVTADKLTGDGSNETTLTGNVELRRNGLILNADELRYSPLTDRAVASGNLRLQQENLSVSGPKGSVKLGSREGQIEQPQFEIKNLQGKGTASAMTFDGVDTLTLENPNYTVCPIDNPNKVREADWYVEADQLEIDQSAEVGRAQSAKVVFQDVPILATPYLSFPTTDRRKSGFLPPSIGSSSRSGTEVTLPYYWNIAPNRDVTFYPTLITSRGVQLGTDARYLGQFNEGNLKLDYLPSDRKADRDRYALSFDHAFEYQRFSAGINANKVSDDQYFVDFSRTQSVASQRVLLREAFTGYRGDGWDANVRVVRHQTLQLAGDIVTEPYDRLPEVRLQMYPSEIGPTFVSADVQYADFASNTRPEASRAVTRARVELPYLAPAFSIKSALSVQNTFYNLDTPLANGANDVGSTIPTFSLDGAIYFDRKTDFFGQSVTQTLEPRLFYLYTPTENQDDQPLLDTTLTGEGFSRIFSENRYAGLDRVGDANQVTAGATSRLTDEKTGAEIIRFDFGQRFYLETPEVQIPGEPPLNGDSDFFLSSRGRITNELSINYFGQFDAQTGRNEKGNISLSYAPGSGQQINAGYRYTRDQINQVDLSGQWPLSRKWSGVGRLNYSVLEKRSIETLIGLEYDDGCWAARFVGQRFAVAPSLSTTSLFFQLELTGLGRVGANPIELLSRKVPGYTPFSSEIAN